MTQPSSPDFGEKPEPLSKQRLHNKVPTLLDVARAAGVSKMAASAALNGSQGSTRVSVETRERVIAAAKELRYRPNANARALTYRRTDAIGFVTTLMGHQPNTYCMEVLDGVVQGAVAAHQSTVIFTLGGWDEAPTRIPALCDGRVDGLIVLAPRLEDDGQTWLPEHTPMVSVHASGDWCTGGVNVESDEEGGAYEMVRRMLALGHRRILHVGGPLGYPGADRRFDGYLRAHVDAGVTPPPNHVARASFSAEGGREAMEAWLQRHRGELLPEALFAGTDDIAVGCMEVLAARGLNIPRDISVVGVDHTVIARTLHMAAVRQPLHEMGHRAVEVLMQLVMAARGGDPYAGPSNVVLPAEPRLGRTLAEPRREPLLVV